MNLTISELAYIKIFLHASKYFSSNIGGYLVGKYLDDSDIQVDDVIPVHHEIPIGPILNIAVDSVIEGITAKGLMILGYYYGFDISLTNSNLPTHNYFEVLREGISARFPSALFLEIDNKQMESQDTIFLKVLKNRSQSIHF